VLDFPNLKPLKLEEKIAIQSIELHVNGGGTRVFASANPDDGGTFAFEKVPAGPVLLNPVFKVGNNDGIRIPSALLVGTTVDPGQTTQFSLFGKGRPIVGRVTLPSSIKPEDCRAELHYVDPPQRDSRYRDMKSDLARHIHAVLESRRLRAALDAQGRFRIEGVQEGSYRISVLGPSNGKPVPLTFKRESKPGNPLVKHDGVALPPMPGGESDEPYDLGVLKCELDEKSAMLDRTYSQLAHGKEGTEKVEIERMTIFFLRFAEANSVLASLRGEVASRKIRDFEATIDARQNAIIVSADDDTLKLLQAILERLDERPGRNRD
jgi:hypothetical protein